MSTPVQPTPPIAPVNSPVSLGGAAISLGGIPAQAGDPVYLLRVPPSGPEVIGTPGNALAFTADGKHVEGVPFPSGFQVEGVPAAGKFVGWDPVALLPQWQTIPVAFQITSFALTSASLVLVGATVSNPTFTAAYNEAATAITLNDSTGDSSPVALPGNAFASPNSFTNIAYGAVESFSITATGPAGTGSATSGNVSIFWGQNVYFGSAVDPGGAGYTAAFIQALGSTLKLGPQGSYGYNAGAGQSAFWAARSAFGLTVANFTVNGFPFACSRVAANVPITVNGVTENFDLFRSDNTGLGAFTLVEA